MQICVIRRVLLLGALGFFSISGFAQEGEDQVEQEVPVSEEAAPVVEEIVVTGSRIRRDEFSSTSPITVINSEMSALAGLLDTADILQNSTIASGQQIDDTFSGFVTDGGPGARSVSLRGLGEQRTLILVNGKRWGPSGVRGGTNSVDLSAIPSSVIARYEILKDGASSVYGADAVAGVVNAITVQSFDGLQFNVQGLVPQAGGAETGSADFTWGRVGPDWSFSVSAGYDKRQRLVQSDRAWSDCDRRPRFTDQNGDGNIDGTSPETGEPLCYGTIYGFVVSPFGWVRYEPSLGEPDPGNPYFATPQQFGIPYYTDVPVHGWNPVGDPDDPEPLWDNEGEFYRDTREPEVNDFISSRELFSVTSFAEKDFDIGGRSANVYYEFYYNQRVNDFLGGHRQFFPRVPSTNPTNPFGIHGPLQARIGRGFAVQPVLPSYEIQDRSSTIKVDRYNAFAGLEGDISATWSYDAYVGYSHSYGTYTGQQWLDDRVTASVNATLDADGNLVCADNSIAGCVPADLFTEDALLRGRLPADVLNFIQKDTLGETTYKSYQVAGYATGRLFEMPNSDDVNAVVGFEMRNEDIHDVPDPEAQADNFWGFTSSGITTGDDTVTEFFTEFEMPLLARLPFAEELLFNASGRYTDYDSYGSDTTYRMALDYQVNPQIRFRATTGTSFRAPDLFEQFLGNQTGFAAGLLDPCINYGDLYDPDHVVYQNCAAQGLPPDHGDQGVPSIRNVVGGNPDLLAETSDAWTAGIVVQPPDIGLSLALTWYEIELENTVQDPSTGYVLGSCYGSAGLSHAFCSRVAPRGPEGFLTDVDASLLNVGRQFTRGFDTDFVYQYEFPSFDLTIDGNINILKEQTTELFDEVWNSVNNWGYPKWTGVMDVFVDYRDWRLLWRSDFIGASVATPVYDPGTDNIDRQYWTDKHWEHTLSARYSASDWELIMTVRNIFDKQPPLVADGVPRDETSRFFNTLPGVGYDILGRTFVLQFSKEVF